MEKQQESGKMNRVSEAIRELQKAMIEEGVEPDNGLPLDLFEYCTSLLPFINVDLLIQNDAGQILLSWRKDKYYGAGWQIPGGIIRMMETIDDRVQKTAIREIGCRVLYETEPIAVHENIIRTHREGLRNQLERAHNIACPWLLRLTYRVYYSIREVIPAFLWRVKSRLTWVERNG